MQKNEHFILAFWALLTFGAVTNARGQSEKTTTHLQQTWTGYMNQTRLSQRWGLWLETQFRTKDNWIEDAGQLVLRAGATRYIKNQTKATAGYAFINNFPNNGHALVSRPEHRIWQQLQWHNNHSRLRLMQWFRLEERLVRAVENDSTLASRNDFTWRMRYNFLMQVPIGRHPFEPGSFAWVLNDEVFVNFGENIIYNSFDQNRFFTGLHFYTGPGNWLQAGYMNLFQQTASGNKYRMIHTFRLLYFHNVDLRKKPR